MFEIFRLIFTYKINRNSAKFSKMSMNFALEVKTKTADGHVWVETFASLVDGVIVILL